ncbi:MAG: hypothetical protein GQE15_09495 [Archangiaceae bacterium]|nr:hypothetical protein [Archangiaceae bacterium]
MRRLTLLGFVLVTACWSEADFREKCEAAGNCIAPQDAGASSDAGVMDAGVMDAGAMDAGVMDAGVMDAGVMDAGVMDAGRTVDAGSPPDGGLTWAAVAAELFNTTNTDSSLEVLAFPVPADTKALGGVLTPRGTVICIPSQGQVLEVFPDGGVTSIFDAGSTNDLWQGGVLQPDGSVFAFPHSVRPNVPAVITPTGLVPFAQQLPGSTPVTEGGVITTTGDIIMMPFSYPAFFVWRAVGVLSEVPVDAGVAPSSDSLFSGAVLRASGTTALAVPNTAASVWEVSATGATPLGPLSGYAGGLLLANGDALLMPFGGGARLARVDAFNGVTAVGPITLGYFSAAWSTNGFGYAIRTVRSAGLYLTIARDGSVTESTLPATARLPDGGTVATNLVLSATSRFGLVAFPDGRLVSCPYADNRLVFIVPNGRRTVPDWVVLSPWLNKW